MPTARVRQLEEVLEDLEGRLAAIEHVRSRDCDDKLAVVEALAAPYAFAFLCEIRRLDAILLKRVPRRSGSRRKRR